MQRQLSRLDFADESATLRLGAAMARLCRSGDVIALAGEIGSGKTVLARACIRALTSPAMDVPSPTFTLVQSYGPIARIGGFVHHVDLYRVEGSDEIAELGLDALSCDDVYLIEWPDRLQDWLPSRTLTIALAMKGNEERRSVRLCGETRWLPRLRELGLA